jgi:aryl-alcohol dehydrogenase-like predicted oxidoreductase
MSFGNSESWHIPEEKALPVLKEAYDKGINTWDTVQTQAHPPTTSSSILIAP